MCAQHWGLTCPELCLGLQCPISEYPGNHPNQELPPSRVASHSYPVLCYSCMRLFPVSDAHPCVPNKTYTKCSSCPLEVNGELKIGIRGLPMIWSTSLSQSPLESRGVSSLAPAVLGPRKLVTVAHLKYMISYKSILIHTQIHASLLLLWNVMKSKLCTKLHNPDFITCLNTAMTAVTLTLHHTKTLRSQWAVLSPVRHQSKWHFPFVNQANDNNMGFTYYPTTQLVAIS